MSIEGLKEKARRHEQKEEWRQALELYRKAIDRLAVDEHPDIGLFNRVGDLYVRIGDLEDAVEHYEQAADLYVEAELPNNAIAVCKKVIRHVPARNSIYLKMGKIRASQGFFTDARQNFLKFAELEQAEGNVESALEALTEFADISPNDYEVRLAVAGQLEQHGRTNEAVQQLKAARSTMLSLGRADEAEAVEARIRELDPEASFEVEEEPEAEAEFPDFETEEDEVEEDEVEEVATAEVDLSGFEIGGAEEDEDEEEAVAEGAEEPVETMDFTLGSETEEDEVELGLAEEGDEDDEVEALPTFGFEEEDEEEEAEAEALPTFGFEEGGEDDEAEAEALPTFGFEEEGEGDEEEAEALPTFGFEEEGDEEAEPLPTLEPEEEAEPAPAEDEEEAELTAAAFGAPDRGEREVVEYVEEMDEMPEVDVEIPGVGAASGEDVEEAVEEAVSEAREEAAAAGDIDELIAAGDFDAAADAVRELIEADPDELAHRQRMVEVAFRSGDPGAQADAYLGLAQCLERQGSTDRARGVYQQVLQIDPENEAAQAGLADEEVVAADSVGVASSDDYVDLGSMIFDEEEEEKTTRFKVAYEQPTGDEEADFARMLDQFKAKVADNVGADDVRAHHDLGTAYKEMGLLDEAIEEFQAALRASRDHLPTYELLGQCFMDKGEHEAALASLKRALDLPYEIEDEMLGIYYFIGRANEALGDNEAALEFYDRVFSLDINFMDVTERLRALR